MKRLAIAGLFLLLSLAATGQTLSHEPSNELPILNRVFTVTLSPTYSCRSRDEFARGYGATALFLTSSKPSSSPDLLFNGACNSPDYFHASTAGDDMALIADLGAGLKLTEVSAHTAFNVRSAAGYENESKFVQSLPVILDHTYVVLLNKYHVRGMFLVKVIGYEPNKSVTLEYTVKHYQRIQVVDKSDGFYWEAQSTSPEKP